MFSLESQSHSDVLYPEVFADRTWGRYSLSSFHDIDDDPASMRNFFGRGLGLFNRYNWEITQHARLNELTSFVMGNEWFRKFKGNLISFELEKIEHARDYCRRLRHFGRWAHAWDTEQDFNVKRRAEKLRVRLVRERQTHILEVVK